MLMRDKLEIFPVWGKLEIKLPVRANETEAIMVLSINNNKPLAIPDSLEEISTVTQHFGTFP